MIGYLKGRILEHSDGRMLIAVGADSSVGYSVAVPGAAEYGAFLPGGMIELHVYTHVREDALDLFGFSSRVEKELFLTLLSVNGIGPKVAMGILSNASTTGLIEAILEGDKAFLTDLPGIGKKTAERVVLELADPIRKKVENGVFQLGARQPSAKKAAPVSRGAGRESAIVRDAKQALMGLGYKENEAAAMIAAAITQFDEETAKPEELIRSALQQTL